MKTEVQVPHGTPQRSLQYQVWKPCNERGRRSSRLGFQLNFPFNISLKSADRCELSDRVSKNVCSLWSLRSLQSTVSYFKQLCNSSFLILFSGHRQTWHVKTWFTRLRLYTYSIERLITCIETKTSSTIAVQYTRSTCSDFISRRSRFQNAVQVPSHSSLSGLSDLSHGNQSMSMMRPHGKRTPEI